MKNKTFEIRMFASETTILLQGGPEKS